METEKAVKLSKLAEFIDNCVEQDWKLNRILTELRIFSYDPNSSLLHDNSISLIDGLVEVSK